MDAANQTQVFHSSNNNVQTTWLQAVLDNSLHSQWGVDAALNLIFFNQQACSFFQSNANQTLELGKKIIEYCNPENKNIWMAYYNKAKR